MPIVTILRGDTLSSIFGGHWEYIYNLPQNRYFKEKMPDPNYIHPGWRLWHPKCIPIIRKIKPYIIQNPLELSTKRNVYLSVGWGLGDVITDTPMIKHIVKHSKQTFLFGAASNVELLQVICNKIGAICLSNLDPIKIDTYKKLVRESSYNDLIIVGVAHAVRSQPLSDSSNKIVQPRTILGNKIESDEELQAIVYFHAIKYLGYENAYRTNRNLLSFGIDPRNTDHNTFIEYNYIDMDIGKKVVLILIGAIDMRRRLSIQYVLELYNYLKSKKINVIISAKESVKELSKLPYINTSLMEYINLIKQCDVLITPDSSGLHIGNAFRKSMIYISNELPLEFLISSQNNIIEINEKVFCDLSKGIRVEDNDRIYEAVVSLLG